MKLLLENWKKYVLKESNKCSYYKRGMCDAFALALHKRTGYPLYVVRGYYWDIWNEDEAYEDSHMVAKKGENAYLDVDGLKTSEELISNSLFMNEITRVDIVPISQEEALYTFTSVGVSDEDIEEAEQYIEQNFGDM
jgi:hypothetical protein